MQVSDFLSVAVDRENASGTFSLSLSPLDLSFLHNFTFSITALGPAEERGSTARGFVLRETVRF